VITRTTLSKLCPLETNPSDEAKTSAEGADPCPQGICISKKLDGHQTHTPETLLCDDRAATSSSGSGIISNSPTSKIDSFTLADPSYFVAHDAALSSLNLLHRLEHCSVQLPLQ
jgi:hypothetical protein